MRWRLHQLQHDLVWILEIAGESAFVDPGRDRVGRRVEPRAGRGQLLVAGVDVVHGDRQPRGLSSHDLELVEYVAPRGVRGDPGICNPGAAHLAITVDDIHDRYERLTAAGARFYSPPNAITAGINEGGFTCYFEDPDQIVLELVQPPAHRLTGAGGSHR